MPVSLSIEDVPDRLARGPCASARGRTTAPFRGELMDILEAALSGRPFRAHALLREIRALGVETPGESVQMICEDRDR